MSELGELRSFNTDELKQMQKAISEVLYEREREDTLDPRPPGTYATFAEAAAAQTDDRHHFTSGAMSSGKKPNYAGSMPLHAFERFARHREFGDKKYGEDNYLKGTQDRAFILDRINHGIEHLKILSDQVKQGNPGNWLPGHDDAAAVMCAGMFVMCYQRANSPKQDVDAAERK